MFVDSVENLHLGVANAVTRCHAILNKNLLSFSFMCSCYLRMCAYATNAFTKATFNIRRVFTSAWLAAQCIEHTFGLKQGWRTFLSSEVNFRK